MLFQPLAAPGAPVYTRILLDIFKQTQAHPDPLSREFIVDLCYKHLAEPQALTLTAEVQVEVETESEDKLADRASAILRYLDRCGWLKSETQNDFTTNYILPDYAFRLLRTFEEIAANDPPPLAGLIFSTFAALQNVLADPETAYLGIPQAHRQTQQLLNGLKELQQNIGLHINSILEQKGARAVLEQLLFRYREEIVDRAYHQLRTTDHVSRFRLAVLDSSRQLESDLVLEPAAQRLKQRSEAASLAEARQKLLAELREIRDYFDSLDRLLQAIDARHSQFVSAAVRTVEQQLTANTTTSGQLVSILNFIFSHSQVEIPLPVHLHKLELLDSGSLAVPGRAATIFEPDISVTEPLTADDLAAVQEQTERQLRRAITHDRVRQFAADLLRDRPQLYATEIALPDAEHLALLIYLRAYGNGSLGYLTTELPDGPFVEHDGFGFRDFVITRI